MTRAIIFDIDGTLLDSVDLHAKAWQEAFAHFGYDVPLDKVRFQIGKGGDELLPVFLSKEQLEKQGKQLEQVRSNLFKEKYLQDVRPFPMVRELFKQIKDDGKKIALASSGKEDEVQKYERIAHIDDLVETRTSSGDVEKSKPHPDIFEAAMQRLPRLAKSEVLVIGDTPHDAVAAKRAGLQTVGVLCGGFPEESLRGAGCIAIYDDPADLLRRYRSSPLSTSPSYQDRP